MNYFMGKRSVLCFSHDWGLLLTRQWLLERLGTAVISVMGEQELVSKLNDLQPNIIILCETLTQEENDRAISLVERCCPSGRCVVLRSTKRKISSLHKQLDPDSGKKPSAFLLEAVRSILEEAPPSADEAVTLVVTRVGDMRLRENALYSIRCSLSRSAGDHPLQVLTLDEVVYRLRHVTGDPDYLRKLRRLLDRSGVLVLDATHARWLAMAAD